MASAQVHERVVKVLMRDIFTRKLKPGDKLPPERELAGQVNADRTSLRVALKQLEGMNLLDIRQGDGIYVRDYLRYAGIDFLRHLLSLEEGEPDGWIMDEFFIDEIYDFWAAVFPEMMRLAARRTTPRDIKRLIDLITEELANLDDRVKLIALEERQQDIISEVGNNLIFLLLSNSARPLRRKIIEIFVTSVKRETLKQFLEAKLFLLKTHYAKDTLEQAVAGADKYRQLLLNFRQDFKKLAMQKKVREEAAP
ncbi:MAG: GntR family transcriptional regulator [Smithellaceae bacterium]|nr:GntR family transcriptional regulator [Smithellaceae bacterium]